MVNYQDFENEWNRYLSTLIQFGRRLENTLNLENTLGSINYKISDVIMYFQENKISITDKVFEKCNNKKISKRSIGDEGEDDGTASKFKETRSRNQELTRIWKKLASEVKKKIKSLKSYWSKLPKGICKNSNSVDKCWNGTSSIELSKQIKPSFIDIKINKNSNVYHLIDLQKNALQVVNNKLISSYNGGGLESFDFDTQASSINIGPISTELNEDNDYEDEDDIDNDEQKREDDLKTIDEQTDKLTEESNNNRFRSETGDEFSPNESESFRKQPDNNNLENDLNNVYSNLDKPRDASLNSNSYLVHISIYTLIISTICNHIITNFNFH